MVRLLVCTGLHLDSPWPDLGPELGRSRREAAKKLLVEVVGSARDQAVDAIAFVGGLTNGQTVLPSTLEFAAKAFASFGGQVAIVPGFADPHGPATPYTLGEWPENTSLLTDPHEIIELAGLRTVGVGATTEAWRPMRPVDAPLTLVGGGMELTPEQLLADGFGELGTVIAGGLHTEIRGSTLTVGQLCTPAGTAASDALLVEVDETGIGASRPIPPFGRTIEITTLDVTGIETTEELRAAVRAIVREDGTQNIVQLRGELQQGVLLPGFLDSDDVDPARLDLSALTYVFDEPGPEATGARPEFEAAVVHDVAPDRIRHQAIALGLRGFASSGA